MYYSIKLSVNIESLSYLFIYVLVFFNTTSTYWYHYYCTNELAVTLKFMH